METGMYNITKQAKTNQFP